MFGWTKPKIDQSCPDFWTVQIEYLNGKSEALQVVWQSSLSEIIAFRTTDDTFVYVPRSSVSALLMDKAYTQIIEMNKEKKDGK